MKIHKLKVLKNIYHQLTSSSSYASSAVPLAYSSYENIKHNYGNTPPVIIMHCLYGTRRSWRSISRAIHQNTDPLRKVLLTLLNFVVIFSHCKCTKGVRSRREKSWRQSTHFKPSL